MRGFLSYLILWILHGKHMTGAEISKELESRKGSRPSPGTVYPALKDLKEKDLITARDDKKYSLTKKGEKELNGACKCFCTVFYDAKEMFQCCDNVRE